MPSHSEIYGNDPGGQNPRALEAYRRILGDRDPRGAGGRWMENIQWNNPNYDWSGVPESLRNLYRFASPRNSEDGLGTWQLRDPGGTQGIYRGADGREFSPIGDESSAVGEGDGSVSDWSRVWYDPDQGMVTTPDNRRSVTSASFRNGRNLTMLAMAAMAGAGLLGAGSGAAAGGAEAFAGATATGELSGGGLLGASPFAGAAAEGGLSGMEGGLLGGEGVRNGGQVLVEASRIPPAGINPGLLAPIATGAAATFNSLDNAPDIDRAPENERPWYQSLADNPLQTIGRGLSLYNMGRGLLGNRGNGGGNNNGGGNDEKGGNGEAVPIQRGPWEPNPITEQQIQNFQYARPRGY